jgi:ABC-type antimicrobial peptide transport system permease subunit
MVERVRVRRPEIGLRMAVGARRRTIVRLVLVDAGRLVLVGSLLGGALAASLNRGLPKLVGGVEPLGLAAFGSLVVLLLAAGLMASLGAALRAARLGPVAALRD